MLRIEKFTVDYQVNPLGIDTRCPLFSWEYALLGDLKQKSYNIIVATQPDFATQSVVWSTGDVLSSQNIGIEYDGQKLLSKTEYFVSLTVTTEGGLNTSAQAKFETALYEKSDWKGKWVSMPTNFQGGAVRFRKELDIPNKPIKRARVYLAGLGYHELYLNGSLLTQERLAPAISEYGKVIYYITYDATPYLKEESNIIGVELGHGWFGDRKMLLQINIFFEDGTEWEDHSTCSHGWWLGGSPVIKNSVYGGEEYDARLEVEGEDNAWATNKFQPAWDNGWMYTVLTAAPSGELRASAIDPIRVCGDYPGQLIENVNGNFIYDVKHNIAGWAKIRVKGSRGTKITLRFGEDLKDDGSVNQLNLRTAQNTDVYILSGKGEEVWEPRYTFHGFRYVEAEIDGQAEILSLTGRLVHNDTKPIGSFECSDEVLNKLHDIAVLTEANNQHGILSDCPQRDERFGWLNDLAARLYQTVCNFSMERFFPKVIMDIYHTQNEKGEISDTAPFYTGGQPADPVSVCYLMLGDLSLRHYGNKAVLKEFYEGFKAWTESLLSRQTNYIMEYYYYADWVAPAAFPDVKTDGLYVSSTYLYWHLCYLADIAKAIGKEQDSQKYAKMAEESKAAIRNKYFDGKNFSTGTQTENAIAISLGLCTKEEGAVLAKAIADDIIKRGYHCTSGNQGYRHLFYAMSEHGYTDLMIDMLKNPEYPGWGYMITKGATSVWERWEAEMQNEMHSFNHPMFGSYDAWFYNCLGGINIDSDAVGANLITIRPYLTKKLEYCNSSIETLQGKIVSNWRKVGEDVIYDITVPSNTSATLQLEGLLQTLNGSSVNAENVDGRSALSLTSGTYKIVAKL